MNMNKNMNDGQSAIGHEARYGAIVDKEVVEFSAGSGCGCAGEDGVYIADDRGP